MSGYQQLDPDDTHWYEPVEHFTHCSPPMQPMRVQSGRHGRLEQWYPLPSEFAQMNGSRELQPGFVSMPSAGPASSTGLLAAGFVPCGGLAATSRVNFAD